jgi:hypothetical protein
MTKLHPHCGQCSQCIDRRFAVLAAGLEHDDPAEAYKVDLFTGERMPGPGRELALAYVRTASDINRTTEVDFFSRYGEASRAMGFFAEPPETVAKRIFDLHRRHAAGVCAVFDRAVSTYVADLREGTLSSSCLLTLIVGQRYRDSAHPEQIRAIVQPTPTTPEIRMTIDRERVIFDRWGAVRGVHAELLIALADSFRNAIKDELAPESFPFIKTDDLRRRLGCKEETIRRRVLRCRNTIARLAIAAGDAPPSLDAVVENSRWHGYRLNPDSIRIVAITEVRRAKC